MASLYPCPVRAGPFERRRCAEDARESQVTSSTVLYPADVDQCDECGFIYATVSAVGLPGRLEAAGPRFVATLATIRDPRRRPAPSVWSPLEYTCHVRDVLRVQSERVALALRADNPEFVPMGREERVTADAYNTQDPQTVLAELAEAANNLARVFDALSPSQWTRTGIYNWPTVQSRTILWLGRHTVHELEHHLLDLTR
jgi:S-DNA-T family DNA segregation ATPase FtsK/SpoIIIE